MPVTRHEIKQLNSAQLVNGYIDKVEFFEARDARFKLLKVFKSIGTDLYEEIKIEDHLGFKPIVPENRL